MLKTQETSRTDDLRGHARRFMGFAMVGGLNTVLDFGVFSGLYFLAGAPLLLANSLAYGLAVLNSFILTRSWTFADRRHDGPLWRELALFVAFNLSGLALGNLVLWLAAAQLPVMAAKVVCMAVTLTWNYCTTARFLYRAR